MFGKRSTAEALRPTFPGAANAAAPHRAWHPAGYQRGCTRSPPPVPVHRWFRHPPGPRAPLRRRRPVVTEVRRYETKG